MNRLSLTVAACGVALASGVASAQGLGIGPPNKLDPAQVQQRIQEQTQQRIQAQAEARAQARTQVQAQQAAERVQQRLEAQIQNQAARAEAAAQRAATGIQQRTESQADAAADALARQQALRARTQATADADAGIEAGAPFGPWNPIRAAAGLQVSANARARGNGQAQAPAQEPSPAPEGETGEEEMLPRPSRGLRVGQFTDLRGTVRAELARTMALRLTAISAMRDRAIEADDVQLLERADRLEGAVRRVLDARARGQVDVQAETVVESELPAAEFETGADAGVDLGVETLPPPTAQP